MQFKKIEDERVTQLNNKIQSEAYYLVLFLAALSVFIKFYVMDLPFTQYVVELGLILFSSIYVAIRSVLAGFDFMSPSNSRKNHGFWMILVLSLVISISIGIRNYSLYGDHYTGIFDGFFLATLAVTFVSTLALVTVVMALLYWINGKGQQRMDRILDDEEGRD